MRRTIASSGFRRRGIALSDLLLTVAVLSVLAGVAVNVFAGVRDAGDKSRLDKDVRTLNLAVTAYLNSGGQIPADATPENVLVRLKSTPASAIAKTVTGLKGSMLDLRLKGKSIGA